MKDLNPIFVACEKYFSKLSPFKGNVAVLRETIEIERLRNRVVFELDKAEKDGTLWWQDKALFGVFDSLYTDGMILLPLSLEERVRWIALVCIAVCITEEFSYENMLMPLDYLPDQNLIEYEDVYYKQIPDVQSFRSGLNGVGWKGLMGL